MTAHEILDAVAPQYLCKFRPEPEGGYTVSCPAFPEIVTHGSTLEEARRNAREAIELCIEVYREKGRPLPAYDSSGRGTIKEIVRVRPGGK